MQVRLGMATVCCSFTRIGMIESQYHFTYHRALMGYYPYSEDGWASVISSKTMGLGYLSIDRFISKSNSVIGTSATTHSSLRNFQ
jgi:hypothetical protein